MKSQPLNLVYFILLSIVAVINLVGGVLVFVWQIFPHFDVSQHFQPYKWTILAKG